MSNKKISIKKNYLYNLSYQFLVVILPIIITPYISRVLKTEAIGNYSYSLSIATYFSLLGNLGLNIYGQLHIASCRDNKEKTSSEFVGIFIAKVITTIASLLLYYILYVYIGQINSLNIVVSLLIISNLFDISWFYQGIERFDKIIFRNYLVKILSIILIFCFVKTPADVVLYGLIVLGTTLLGNIALWLDLKKHIDYYSLKNISIFNHIKKSLVYFIPTIASSVYTVLDKSMLGWIVNSAYENGVYEQAHKIELALVSIITSLSTVLLPRMAYLHHENKKEKYKEYLGTALRFVGFIAIPMVAGCFSVADIFIPIFLGDGYEKCINLLKIFSFLIFFGGFNTLIGNQCLVAQKKQGFYNSGVICGAIINLFLNVILINRFQSEGAAIASVLAEFSITIIFLYHCRAEINVISMLASWSKYVISSLIMALIIIQITKIGEITILLLAIQIFLGMFIYFGCLFLLKDSLLLNIVNIFVNQVKNKIFKYKIK